MIFVCPQAQHLLDTAKAEKLAFRLNEMLKPRHYFQNLLCVMLLKVYKKRNFSEIPFVWVYLSVNINCQQFDHADQLNLTM